MTLKLVEVAERHGAKATVDEFVKDFLGAVTEDMSSFKEDIMHYILEREKGV